MRNNKNTRKLQRDIKQLVIRDSDIIAEMVCEAVVSYEVKDLNTAWKRLLKSIIFESSIHDVLAILPIRRKR